MCRSKAKNLPTMCLPSTMVTRTRALMNASILDCRLTATIFLISFLRDFERRLFMRVFLSILLMNETRKSNALFFSLSFGIQFFLSNRMCVKRFCYAHDEQREFLSLSRFLLLNCTSFRREQKKQREQQQQRESSCACVRVRSLSFLSFLSSSSFVQ